MLAVKPAIDAVVALLYVLCGNNEAAYDNNVVFPVDGLPTIKVWILWRALCYFSTIFATFPYYSGSTDTKDNNIANLTVFNPLIYGQKLSTNFSKS